MAIFIPRYQALVLGLFLFVASLPTLTHADCGFQAEAKTIGLEDDGVPLLFRPLKLIEHARKHITARQQREGARYRLEEAECPAARAYVRGILDRLIKGSKLNVQDAAEVELAFRCSERSRLPVARAVAGRFVHVPAQLLTKASSEDAVAAVLAHELAHITLRHSERFIDTVSRRLGFPGGTRALKREHEREADIAGLKILANAGYDSTAAIDHLKLVDEIASTRRTKAKKHRNHDPAQERLRLLHGQIESCGYPMLAQRTPVDERAKLELN